MARSVRYREIADEIRGRIDSGEWEPGAVLPSEAELSRSRSVSRVTVRRALEILRAEGLVDSRQGFGWFVAVRPVRQELAGFGTIEQQLTAGGIEADRQILDFVYEPAVGRVAEVLGEGEVLRVRRLNLADGRPFARVTVWCPAALAAELSRAQLERHPFVELIPVAVAGATQTIGAAAVGEEDAELLGVPAGSPVLRVERVTHGVDGAEVLVAEHVFPAHRTEFVVELPHEAASFVPTGLRLVD